MEQDYATGEAYWLFLRMLCNQLHYRAGTLESARPEVQISVLPLESYVSMKVLNSANIHGMVVKIK